MANPDNGALSDLVRRVRLGLGWTQSRFAEALGIDQTTVSQYEVGRAIPSSDVLIKMMGTIAGHEDQQPIYVELSDYLSTRLNHSSSFFAHVAKRNRSEPPPFASPPVGWKAVGSGLAAEPKAESGSESAALSRIIELHQASAQLPDTEAIFVKAADYIEVELSRLRRRPRPRQGARRSKRSFD